MPLVDDVLISDSLNKYIFRNSLTVRPLRSWVEWQHSFCKGIFLIRGKVYLQDMHHHFTSLSLCLGKSSSWEFWNLKHAHAKKQNRETISFKKQNMNQCHYQVGKSHQKTKLETAEGGGESSIIPSSPVFTPSIHRKELKRPKRRNAMDPKATKGPFAAPVSPPPTNSRCLCWQNG